MFQRGEFDLAVVTLVERLSKVIITLKPDGRKAKDIEKVTSAWLSTIPNRLFKSITFDCGKEFSNWQSLSNQHDIDIYFADPGTPSQRALNEHSNGRIKEVVKSFRQPLNFTGCTTGSIIVN